MKIYDISQEVFSCAVYDGDTAPSSREVRRISRGDLYNLTDFTMCAHNGTHIDAPFHFFADGDTVEQIPLHKTVGRCFVAEFDSLLGAFDAERILRTAGEDNDASRRILLKGNAVVTCEAAEVFANAGIELLGVESQSVGEIGAPMAVHKILLAHKVVLLEGIRLGEVPEGEYMLCCAPICLGGADGAPCRALLIE